MSLTPVYLRRNQAGLVLGTLNLLSTSTVAGKTFQIEAQGVDMDLGTPIPIDVAVQRWMTDGAVASTQGHENREIFFNIIISARTSAELAAGEKALARFSGEPTTLTWTPPEGSVLAPSTVFEVWTWHLEPAFDIDRELRLARKYGVRITAKPWARSVFLTTAVAPAVPGSPTITLVDNCSVITGWTGTPNTPTVVGGTSIRETVAITGGAGSTVVATLTRTGSVTGLNVTPYLTLDMATTGGTVFALTVQFDGVSVAKVAQIGTVSYWQTPAGVTSFTNLTVTAGITATHGTGNCTLTISDVSKTDTIGGVGSRKQLTRHLDVGGSVPTSGSINVASPSATALGSTLVYTRADDGSGYNPPLRQYRTSGGTVTADATMVSGSRETFVTTGTGGTAIIHTIPAAALPEATYVVMGRFNFTTSVVSTMTVTMTAKASGLTVTQTIVGTVASPLASPVTIWGVIGVLSLPTLAQPSESQLATVLTTTASATASATVTLDELYIFDITRGALSFVLSSPVNPFTQVWLDAPDQDPTRNRPAVYVGNVSDRSDAVTPMIPGAIATQIKAIGDHDLDPDGALIFTVTDGVDNAVVTGSFFHRWHTHAGD